MIKTEYEEVKRILENARDRVKTDDDFSRRVLARTGIYNPDGSLSDNFNKTCPSCTE